MYTGGAGSCGRLVKVQSHDSIDVGTAKGRRLFSDRPNTNDRRLYYPSLKTGVVAARFTRGLFELTIKIQARRHITRYNQLIGLVETGTNLIEMHLRFADQIFPRHNTRYPVRAGPK